MNVAFAALTAAYEGFVTLAALLAWEIILVFVKYLPLIFFFPILDPMPPGLLYFTLTLALILSFLSDVGQIYFSAVDDDIRSLSIYGVRVGTNYIIYAFLVTVISLRHGFNTNYFTEAQLRDMLGLTSGLQRTINALLSDATSISIGRFCITFFETLISIAARGMDRLSDANQ